MVFWMSERRYVLMQVLFDGVLLSSLLGGVSYAVRWACMRRERQGTGAGATLGGDATLGAGGTLGGIQCGAIVARAFVRSS